MNALERAKAALQFDDIYQSSASAALGEAFDSKVSVLDEASCQLQFKHVVKQSNVLNYRNSGDTVNVFRVFIDVGVRLLINKDSEVGEDPILQIEATYCVDYRITQASLQTDQEALDAFALENASYHLWPFWREFVMSQCSRMNVPKIPLPLRFIGSPSSETPTQD
ncbi:preprotein translocase subunit SecB [Gammaproteobacteria bacterium LSUCC0112]|nr:preprotein translocase subunit SecB [Gammaproteobacteria bacterium LSUCC0112]